MPCLTRPQFVSLFRANIGCAVDKVPSPMDSFARNVLVTYGAFPGDVRETNRVGTAAPTSSPSTETIRPSRDRTTWCPEISSG
jgi:hypothetical protein